jgi:hypothetical protein
MTLQEIKTLCERTGWQMWVCDTPIASYENYVQAGVPSDVGDMLHGDYIYLPKELVTSAPTRITVRVRGDSMQDAGVLEGDMIEVQLTEGTCGIRDGDIVVACVDGAMTIKTFYHEDDKNIWLLPRNDKYTPIHLTPEIPAHIVGKVVAIRREAPHTPMGEMMRIMKQVKHRGEEVTPPSQRSVRSALIAIGPRIGNGRQWFAVYRALVDTAALCEGDYQTLVDMIRETLPEHPHQPVASELRRMSVQSFRKPLPLWQRHDAPVQGSRFDEYYGIAKEMRSRVRR